MTDSIGIKITELIGSIVPLNLAEAETGEYPYAVYDYTPVPQMTKDGIYKFSADATITVMSQDYDSAMAIVDQIADAIQEGMTGPEYTATPRNMDPECTEGIWAISLNYTINQYI